MRAILRTGSDSLTSGLPRSWPLPRDLFGSAFGIIVGEAVMARNVYTAQKNGDDRLGNSRRPR